MMLKGIGFIHNKLALFFMILYGSISILTFYSY